MFKRGRGTFFAVGLVVGIGLALIFLVWAIPEFRSLESAQEYYHQWNAAAQAHQEQQPEETHFWIRELYGWAYAEDSLAQWLMAVLGGAATAISLYALIWLRRTWDQTRRGADAAWAAIDQTRRIGEAQVRAYLSFESVEVNFSVQNLRATWVITVAVRNTGQSPARRVTGYANDVIFTRDEKGTHIPDIPANGTRKFVVLRYATLEENEWTYEKRNEETGSSVFVDVAIEYRDVFDSPIPHWERSRFIGSLYLDKEMTKIDGTPGSLYLYGKLETEYGQG